MRETKTKATTPTRRSALGFSAAAIVAGLTTPVLAKGVLTMHTPDPDTALINRCDQFVAVETERYLLHDHDDCAPDFGPNNARYENLSDETQRLIGLIGQSPCATTPAGHAAVARAALTWLDLDIDGNIQCSDFGDELTALLVRGVAPDFVWPPLPGSCSMAHWAAPTSPAEIAEHRAAYKAETARLVAADKAKRAAEQAERDRLDTPEFLTDDELQRQLKAAQRFKARSDQITAELVDEMARRGLA